MPVVFIHGVNVREDPDYRESVNGRNALLRRFALADLVSDPQRVALFDPYWGDQAAKFAWNHACLPEKGVEALGADDQLPALLLREIPDADLSDSRKVLLSIARGSLELALDLLWATSLSRSDEKKASDLAQVAMRAVAYAKNNPCPAWLNEVKDDAEFLRELQRAITISMAAGAGTEAGPQVGWEALGISELWDGLKEGLSRIGSAVPSAITTVGVSLARSSVHRKLSVFLGDVFTYLKERGTANSPGPIVQSIVGDLDRARLAVGADDPRLVVIAHSMGGNIMYDILTCFRPDLKVDVLVTVGSQVALFEELKLFVASDHSVPRNPAIDRVTRPPNLDHWINIFDCNDMLGYATQGVFSGVTDYSYSTGAFVTGTHSAYFIRPSFYDRLGERLKGVWR